MDGTEAARGRLLGLGTLEHDVRAQRALASLVRRMTALAWTTFPRALRLIDATTGCDGCGSAAWHPSGWMRTLLYQQIQVQMSR